VNCALVFTHLCQFGGPDLWIWSCYTCGRVSGAFSDERKCIHDGVWHGVTVHPVESSVPRGFRGILSESVK
jgi:hypothetical protein